MPPRHAEKVTRRVAVILGPGGSSQGLLNLVLPLLGRDKAIEMQGLFLEEAELKHAADLPFVKELCRVTFSVREFNSDQFEQLLALRMRTAQRALSVLAERAGVPHSFRNVRGSAISLLRETAGQSDITIFEPVRSMAEAMSAQPRSRFSPNRIVVVAGDRESGGKTLLAASHLAGGDMGRVTLLLEPPAAGDSAELDQLLEGFAGSLPGRIRAIDGRGINALVDAALAENAAILVTGATEEYMNPETLLVLRQRLRCPICLVRYWGENGGLKNRKGP